MLNKRKWSSRFSWCYALLMALAIVLFSFIFIYFNTIKMSNLRLIYSVVILAGTFFYIQDFTKSNTEPIGFKNAFLHCARTGIYTCIALLPAIIIFLLIGLPTSDMLDATDKLAETKYQFRFVVSNFLELSAIVAICSFLGAFVPGIIQNRKGLP